MHSNKRRVNQNSAGGSPISSTSKQKLPTKNKTKRNTKQKETVLGIHTKEFITGLTN